jgi:hypothetical protein
MSSQKSHEKMLNITKHSGYENQTPYTLGWLHSKKQKVSVGKEVKSWGPVYD